ncbi:protein RER1-like [Lytechinus variegatus]|uniref:protein RER1-like n=1 Tax=Lytechinus variegatus TaxID=7654 RepID=UPI001BB1C713|nr:protein RER1-like [Lytechinus variegatus]XP_041479676.1 protein RER1-like [Lytechinus variegatus]
MNDTSKASDTISQPSFFSRIGTGISQRYQSLLDRSVPYAIPRWIGFVSFYIIYLVRIFFIQGWYIITYALAIYHLNLFIAFLSPKIDPAVTDDPDDDGPALPTKSGQEFRPFIRRLPEFKFWHSATKAILIAMTLTFFELFNVPVFWPILVMYFFLLFFLTMRRQIEHMIKYRYLPWTRGKTKYKGKEDTGDVIGSQ